MKIVTLLALAGVYLTGAPQTQPEPLVISIPGKMWAIQVTAPGFKVTQNVMQPDGRGYLLAENGPFAMSVALEAVRETATLAECEDDHRRRIHTNPFRAVDVKESKTSQMAVLEYLIPDVNGVPVNQKNVFGCTVKENIFADLHISKTSFTDDDQPRMMAILASARFVPAAATQAPAGSAALLAEGSAFFRARQFEKAIVPYQQALELEKKEQKLDGKLWRVLLENLAMAHGITGNLEAAEEVMKYGISKDPFYPMFYYITANVYAERDDLPSTLKYLRLALLNKSNMNAGETLDPSKDDSFARFMNNEEFNKLAAQFR